MASRVWHCLLALSLLCSVTCGQLSLEFYKDTCQTMEIIVRTAVTGVVLAEPRMGASLLRLFFNDCFVQGCDGSILLDDVGSFVGEKTAEQNLNSVRGYEVIDTIKAELELVCPGVVSCADIVALAARDGTVMLGGPTWDVPLGRRDSTTASLSQANSDLPRPTSSLAALIAAFDRKGLTATDMTALSGAHTFGFARCTNFLERIYSGSSNLETDFARLRQRNCPEAPGTGDGNLAPLDEKTPRSFDNAYYGNLLAWRGLLRYDQELYNSGSQDALVRHYSSNLTHFTSDFVAAMNKMGNIGVLTGSTGEVRAKCRVVNS